MTKLNIYALIVLADKAAFFGLHESEWISEPIRGELWTPLDGSKESRTPWLVDQFNERLNNGNLADCELHILYDDAAAVHLTDHLSLLLQRQCQRWQVLRIQPLRQRAIALSGNNPDAAWPEDWIRRILLPVLQSTFNYSDDAQLQERLRAKQEHEATLESLGSEKYRLLAQLTELEGQLQALQLPEVEKLLVYLPAIYRNVWGSISPSDLGLLAGTIKIPEIASPFPEPSADTLSTLQRRLRKLPATEQQRLHTFCRNLSHRLQLRAEMRDWLERDDA